MNEKVEAATETSRLVKQLADVDAVVREKAREQLIQLGTPDVTRALLQAVIDPRTHVRWEAAKTLQAIADPVAAAALMHALEDEDADVRWVAAEGLIALHKVGLRTVFSGLITLRRIDRVSQGRPPCVARIEGIRRRRRAGDEGARSIRACGRRAAGRLSRAAYLERDARCSVGRERSLRRRWCCCVMGKVFGIARTASPAGRM